ncbi:MAG: ATP phosphoribosyltransferase, partial [Hyphomicrobiales bacterium]|nr:ATP phosphoribosyltransferase [Hyphomicrobiales bacterium]
IVDITSTGSTLAANALKVLDDGVMLRSEANLVAALTADWNAAARAALTEIFDRIAAEERARTMREIRAAVSDPVRLGRHAADHFEARLPFGAVGGAGQIVLHCPEGAIYDCAAWLKAQGAETVTVSRLDYVFEGENPMLEDLLTRIDAVT